MPRNGMKIGLIVAGGVLGLLTLLYVVRFVALHYVAKSSESVVSDHYKPEDILRKDLVANGRGLLSKGVAMKGNGALVLTKKELAWFQLAPSGETIIPLSKITSVDIVHEHNGYSGRPLLQVHFTTDGGGSDAWAWYVQDQDDWKRDIDKARTGS